MIRPLIWCKVSIKSEVMDWHVPVVKHDWDVDLIGSAGNRQWALTFDWPLVVFVKQLICAAFFIFLFFWFVFLSWPNSDSVWPMGHRLTAGLISGVVDQSCRLVGSRVSCCSHNTGCFCPVVRSPAGPRRLWPGHRFQLRPEARSSAASWR